MKTCLAILLILVPLVSAEDHQVTETDYSVMSQLISTALPTDKSLTIYIWHQVERSEVYDYKAMEGFRKAFKHLDNTLFDGYNHRNWDRRSAVLLGDHFKLARPTVFLTPEAMKKHLGREMDPGWWLNPTRLPSGGLVVRLSLPSYSPDGNRAFVFAALYQRQRADQTYFLLKRGTLDEPWKIVEKVTWWSCETPDYTNR